jgi:hypothetical protein
VRLEGLGQLKNPMTLSGIEPATFQLGEQCLNQTTLRVVRDEFGTFENTVFIAG